MKYDLHCEFDIEQHKKHFINYFEAIILPNGKVVYAVPSHQEKLIGIACDKFQWSRNQLNDKCPQEFYCDFLQWLLNITGCVSCWSEFCIKCDNPTKEQLETLKILKENKLCNKI